MDRRHLVQRLLAADPARHFLRLQVGADLVHLERREPHELEPEHRTGGGVVRGQLLGERRPHRRIGHRARRAGVGDLARQHLAEQALDAGAHARHQTVVHAIERQPDELRDQHAGIRDAYQHAAGGAHRDLLDGARQREVRDHVEGHLDRAGEHEVHRQRLARLGRQVLVMAGTEQARDGPCGAHHHDLVGAARHIHRWAERERVRIDELVRSDGVSGYQVHRAPRV